ncbi:MAG: lysylphosphatidylglycerol synthase transmembrane domain-containing protein [Chitinophagaceae bacterium]
MKKIPKPVQLFLKIAVTVACLWYVSGKIDFAKAGIALKNANWLYLLLALLLFIISKLISSFRLNIYFRNINIRLPEWQNIKLYWLGMFYNLFLPGSISGDAYKVIVLTKKFNVPYKKTAAAVLLDRFSGLLGLGLILAVYSVIVLDNRLYVAGIISGAIVAVAGLYFIIRNWFKDFISSFISTLFLGFLVQASQVVCAYLIMAALGIPAHVTEYIFIFLVSSVVAVLPLTIGGLGAREVVFLEGSKYFGLIQENSVVISILFYLITLFTSVWGLLYIYKDPLKADSDTALARPSKHSPGF